MIPPPPKSTLFPYTTLFRSNTQSREIPISDTSSGVRGERHGGPEKLARPHHSGSGIQNPANVGVLDRKSTRLNSSHGSISYAVFCLKKKISDLNYEADLLRA